MLRSHRFLRFALVTASLAVLASSTLLGSACSNQGEGERCDTAAANSGNDDCQSGLVCTPAHDLNVNGDRCCPSDRTQATTSVCALSQGPVDGGLLTPEAAPPVDAPPAEASAGDSSADAPSEASPDAAPDAPGDAPSE